MAGLISIIVPVYNAETVLEECVSSIFAQTYKNYEIILVNDGSTDKSASVCDKIAAENVNVKVIHQPNAGPSAARKTGLKASSGEYITFVDSDDEIAPTYLELLLTLLNAHKADVSAVSYQNIARGESFEEHNTLNIHEFSGEDAVEDVFYQKTLDHAQWGKLFRKEIIAEDDFAIQFRTFEDLYFIYKTYSRSNRIVWANQRLYVYHLTDHGQLNGVTPMCRDAFMVLDKIMDNVKNSKPRLAAAVNNRRISISFNILKTLTRTHRHNPVNEAICWRNIKSLRRSNFLDPNVRLKNKVGILASLLGRSILLSICRLTKK